MFRTYFLGIIILIGVICIIHALSSPSLISYVKKQDNLVTVCRLLKVSDLGANIRRCENNESVCYIFPEGVSCQFK